jgi:hypothetical protein
VRRVREAGLYVAAGVVFVAIGVAWPPFMISWPVAVAYLLLVAWALPALLRRR